LPFAPRPFPDELLLSWICRLAAANHVSLDLFFPEMKVSDILTPSCLRLREVSILRNETTEGRIADEVA